ncbi:MAG: cytochrome P450 [Actinomycetota bacterium]|nr:MAG: cytochrome P450 [Actinomycetota bacterium]
MSSLEVTPGWALEHFDPWDKRINYGNVWQMYQAMRHKGPAVYSDAHGGFWSIVRYKDIKAAARDYRVFSSARGTSIGARETNSPAPPKAPIEYDPPEHTRLRKAMQTPFLPNNVRGYVDGVRSSVRELLDRISVMGSFDIVSDLAEPVPQEVLAKTLGFDEEAKIKNRELVLAVVHAEFGSAQDAWKNFRSFLAEEIRKRQARPGDDFFSHLCNDEFDGARFTEPELISILVALALAGHHTTINGISSLLRRTAEYEVKKAYLNDSRLVSNLVEETLRCDPPIHLEARTTTEAVVVGGVKIPADSQVALVYASGNHDESEFDRPEEFDFTRGSNLHLSFGHGIHSCSGMHLARLEMSIVLEETMKRFPNYALIGEQIDSGLIYGHHMGWESIPATIG